MMLLCNFNEGKKSSIEILAEVQIQAGHYTTLGCIELNKNRVSRSIYQQSPANATRRKVKRGMKKRKTDKHTEKEGVVLLTRQENLWHEFIYHCF